MMCSQEMLIFRLSSCNNLPRTKIKGKKESAHAPLVMMMQHQIQSSLVERDENSSKLPDQQEHVV